MKNRAFHPDIKFTSGSAMYVQLGVVCHHVTESTQLRKAFVTRSNLHIMRFIHSGLTVETVPRSESLGETIET